MTDAEHAVQLDPDLDDRLCRLLVGWDALEQRNGAKGIIDFNVAGIVEADRFEHRVDVLEAIVELRRSCDPGSFVGQRLTAHETYLRALMGQQFSFDAYVAATQAVLPATLPDRQLRAARTVAETQLAELGVNPNGSIDDQLSALDPPLPFDTVEQTFRSMLDEHRHSLEDVIGQPVPFELTIEDVEVDEYWSYWVDGAGTEFRLRLNRKRGSFTRVECLQFTFHELLAHCGQMKAWATHIAAGNLPRYFGLTTVHAPEQVMLEGLAQTLPLLIPNEAMTDPVLAVRLALMRHRLMIDNNLHCMINTGATVERCASYHEHWSLGSSTRRAITDLAARGAGPLYRSYLYAYPAGCELFWSAHERLRPEQQAELVRACYRGPQSADAIRAFIDGRR